MILKKCLKSPELGNSGKQKIPLTKLGRINLSSGMPPRNKSKEPQRKESELSPRNQN